MRQGIIFLIIFILTACGELVRFETPQPEGQSDEKAIPRKLFGQYLALNDSSSLLISRDLIIRYSNYTFSEKIDSTDRAEIKGDTVYSGIDHKIQFDITIKGDSTFQNWNYIDTLFHVSRGDILRKFKGHYFLNQRISSNYWIVTKLTRIQNGLTLGKVEKKEDIQMLRELTGIKADTVFRFRPTKKELKRFIEENGFSSQDTYLKVK
jgi:hypothetical protein